MNCRSLNDLSAEVPVAVVRTNIVDDQMVQNIIGIAFTKATDASSTSISLLTRMDAAYDAILMFASAVSRSNGFYVSTAPQHDRYAFEGMASILNFPESLFEEILRLSRWPLRKYNEGLNISVETLTDVMRAVRLIIRHVNVWLPQASSEERRLA